MLKKMKILMFPGFCALFLLLAYMFGGEDLAVMMKGDRSTGRVTGLIRYYDQDQCDAILDIEQQLTMTLANGATIEAVRDRDGVRRLTYRLEGLESTFTADQIQQAGEAGAEGLLPELTAAINAVARTHSDSVMRFLQREENNESERRVVNIRRAEYVQMVTNVNPLQLDFRLTEQGRIGTLLQDGEALPVDELVTTINFAFIGGTEESKELKTNVRREQVRTLNGATVPHDSEDFILYEKDYRYAFRPVLYYNVDDQPFAALADIGARRSPRGGHKIGDKVELSYMPETPELVVLRSDFSILKEQGVLDSINSFFELTFGRWFFPAISLVVAMAYFIMSVITISLAVQKPKTENADTVDTARL